MNKLGPYKLENILGRGGMGTVYRAIHQKTEEVLAVKVLAPYYANDSHFRARFESEIKSLIKLNHENIVRLISYGQEEANLFFAMELVEGQSLFQLQRDGKRFDWREVIKIGRHVAAGLRHAHDRGVIHRDLKPGNLLQSNEGLVKITDFGIAKNFGTSQNTGNNVLGTMDFMSPEQAKGRPVTVRSDLYSLGTLMYTLLSGRPPFSGNSVEESLKNLTSVPAPRVVERAPDVPAELDDLIAQLMQKKPDDRVPTAQALLHRIESLETMLRDYSVAETAERPPVIPADETSEIESPATSAGPISKSAMTKLKGNTEVEPERRSKDSQKRENKSGPKKAAPVTKAEKTVAEPRKVKLDSGTQIDYFNTVTEQQRRRQEIGQKEKPDPGLGGILAVGGALLAIVVLALVGIYFAYRTPPADQLLETILAKSDSPKVVRQEIGQFLEAYPEHEQVDKVKYLAGLADAMAVYSRLSVQRNALGANELNDFEKRFVSTIDLCGDDPARAYKRLGAMITLYETRDDLAQRDQQCLEAARMYRTKIKTDAQEKQNAGEEQIHSAMARAQQSQPEEARKIYTAIIELYQDSVWAGGHVDAAKQKIKELNESDGQ